MNDEPDLIVSASFAISDATYVNRGPDFIANIKASLRDAVESQLPEGYGQDHGDYAEHRLRYDTKTRMNIYTYEVHL